MKHPLALLFALVAIAVLLGTGSMLNSACKISPHAWCAPAPKIRHVATQDQEHDSSAGRAASHVRMSSQK
jgi:hypothetical protein